MPKPGIEFRVLADRAIDKPKAEGEPSDGDRIAFDALSLPNEPSCLAAVKGGGLQVSTADEAVREASFVFEPLWGGAVPQLVLLSAKGANVMVNGSPAPRIALLREKDEIALEDTSSVLRVTLYRRASIGTPPPAYVGKPCPLCRRAFTATTRVYVCYNCGTPMHMEGDEVPEEERLTCSGLVTECMVCHMPVLLDEGYTYFPSEGKS